LAVVVVLPIYKKPIRMTETITEEAAY
jgi:hypothetical protein